MAPGSPPASNPEVDAIIERSERWSSEIAALRTLLTGCGLTEELKWAKACYTSGGRNIAIIQEMKSFLALMFFKGALIDDPGGLLEAQGPNSRSARRVRITSTDDVARLAPAIENLVAGAVDVEESGRELAPAPPPPLAEELQARLDADPALHAAFEALTPGRQRAYNLDVSGAKRSETRARRVEQHVPKILAGKGLRDR